uniref:Uncharacterized protein n=1 Tax=viral metagenome TaxID=1070528 RepID=A0A6C0H7Z5_9ZZZZ
MWNDNKLYTDFLINKYSKNDLVNSFLIKLKNKNIDLKIDKLEIEYEKKIKELIELSKIYYNTNLFKNKNSLELIQKELEITKILTKYTLLNKDIDYSFLLSSLNILLYLSEILRNRLNQEEYKCIKENKISDYIIRSSYKFCTYKDKCNYNYNINTKLLCYHDHYVHNMISSDLKIIINYINNKQINNEKPCNKEILKTINTINYVINHMENELNDKCAFEPINTWDNFHFVKK